jgi:dTDP-4-dehydrorhamnose 3,5-epimerase
MKISETGIEGLMLIEQPVFADERGIFIEAYHKEKFKKAGIATEFVQDNISVSAIGVLRGLHFQNPPFAQGKLVRVLKGSALDVAVDIRKDSPSYGKHFSVILSAEKNNLLWIPEGFAHGFVALEDETVFFYKCTNYYNKESEDAIIWNDSDLNISWSVQEPLISGKDKEANSFKGFKSLF